MRLHLRASEGRLVTLVVLLEKTRRKKERVVLCPQLHVFALHLHGDA